MSSETTMLTIGRVEPINFPELAVDTISARIDTGARTSSIWGSAELLPGGNLRVSFFDNKSLVQDFTQHGQTVVSSSNGHAQQRYTIKLLVVVAGRRIRAKFTIANRESQVYPVLIGRNILRGKFVVDVKKGIPLVSAEKNRSKDLKQTLSKDS